jgi:hypothetical protein
MQAAAYIVDEFIVLRFFLESQFIFRKSLIFLTKGLIVATQRAMHHRPLLIALQLRTDVLEMFNRLLVLILHGKKLSDNFMCFYTQFFEWHLSFIDIEVFIKDLDSILKVVWRFL